MPQIEPAGGGAALTVIIPTFNRSCLLGRTLAALERQTVSGFRVIVIDDGSTDDTAAMMAGFARRSPLRVHFVRQGNGGPARARNAGLALVETPLVVMIGDDTWPEPGFVAAHLAFHAAHPDPRDAAIGHTRWCEEMQVVTPFMRWLDTDGYQFGFGALLAGDPPGWQHFYTSNLSAKLALTGRQLFDETFTAAAMEDIEAGWRLTVERGLRLSFLPDAVVRHVHPMDFVDTCRRAQVVGEGKRRFHAIWPDKRPTPRRPVRQALFDMLARPWSLAVLTPLAGAVARRRADAWLVRTTIKLHEAAGSRDAAGQATALPPSSSARGSTTTSPACPVPAIRRPRA